MRLKEEDNKKKKIDQLPSYIWINGEFVENRDAKLHVFTHSLHYSSSVYEGEKAYNSEHVMRFSRSGEPKSI